ncbi:uncharacterized protein LOC129343633 isoform X3 [Eublepharis macularius]|uniref:Uncharacterized protein LOC129343633 isoform X3 n=1 Tax=Eublepharis macularius TaxID=481883 RepID=A0AA97KFE3_EUBMA|nr:uncharacterized protein LOC129343633 isoform X3 [Eublepharis macularius]
MQQDGVEEARLTPQLCSTRVHLAAELRGARHKPDENKKAERAGGERLESAVPRPATGKPHRSTPTAAAAGRVPVPFRSPLLCSWLSEVQKKHGEQPSRTQQVSKPCKRNRRYKQHLHYLHHMHYFSLVNMVSSKRMLEKNGQFSGVRTEQSVHDLMEYLFPNRHEQSGMNHNIKIMEENTFPSLVGSKQQEMNHKVSSKMYKGSKEKKGMLKQHTNKVVGERAEDEKCNVTTFAQQEIITVPLTLEDASLYHPVVEVKPRGTDCKNYPDKDSINGKSINYKRS